MKKNIIISESQYNRIFLNEQYTSADGTFYGANDVDAYKKNVLNNKNQNKSSNYPSNHTYTSDLDITKPLGYDTQTPSTLPASAFDNAKGNISSSVVLPDCAFPR